MFICPYCGSTAIRKVDWDIDFYGDEEVVIHRDYMCKECGEYFRTDRTYNAIGSERVCEEDE